MRISQCPCMCLCTLLMLIALSAGVRLEDVISLSIATHSSSRTHISNIMLHVIYFKSAAHFSSMIHDVLKMHPSIQLWAVTNARTVSPSRTFEAWRIYTARGCFAFMLVAAAKAREVAVRVPPVAAAICGRLMRLIQSARTRLFSASAERPPMAQYRK